MNVIPLSLPSEWYKGERYEQGIYKGLPFSVYGDIPAMNTSRLSKMYNDSPLHLYHDRGIQTRATDLGDIYHSLVLEPEQFSANYVLQDQCSETTGKGSRCKKSGSRVLDGSFNQVCSIHTKEYDEAAFSPTQIVSNTNWDAAHRMRDATMSHAFMANVINNAQRELTVVFEYHVPFDDGDEIFGQMSHAIPAKGRVDIDVDEISLIADLKSSSTTNPYSFMRKAADFGYHRQLAFYGLGMELNGKHREEFFWFVQENQEPWDAVAMAPDEASLDQGRREIDRLMTNLRDHLLADSWPGNDWGQQVVEVSLPEYKFR